VSTFYVLPPRSLLGDRLADLLRGFLPGLDWDVAARQELAELVLEAALCGADAYAVLREDLAAGEGGRNAPGPGTESLVEVLRDGYGAEPGDEVVEVRPSARPGEWWTRRWRLQSLASPEGLPPASRPA
jgi:hypothetical protein